MTKISKTQGCFNNLTASGAQANADKNLLQNGQTQKHSAITEVLATTQYLGGHKATLKLFFLIQLLWNTENYF